MVLFPLLYAIYDLMYYTNDLVVSCGTLASEMDEHTKAAIYADFHNGRRLLDNLTYNFGYIMDNWTAVRSFMSADA